MCVCVQKLIIYIGTSPIVHMGLRSSYEPHTSSAICCFECGNVFEICDEIITT